VTELGSVEIKDRWEPLEEGLDPIETVRNVSSISVHLSKKQLNENAAGYQPPIERESEEQVQLLIEAMDAPYKRPSAGGPRGKSTFPLPPIRRVCFTRDTAWSCPTDGVERLRATQGPCRQLVRPWET